MRPLRLWAAVNNAGMLALTPLPAFADNYLWLLDDGHDALMVDPGDAAVVRAALQQRRLRLTTIMVTHHHADHTGGVAELAQATGAQVWAPAAEANPGVSEGPGLHWVQGGDHCHALGLQWRVLAVPGHTAGHVAYWSRGAVPDTHGWLFCGDTLFSAGCGRLFEGTAAQMWASLQTLAALPGDTALCCAHEYTLANLRFALAVEPHNTALQAHWVQAQALRAAGQPTLPSHVALERAINPFLRCAEPAVAEAAQRWAESQGEPVPDAHDPVAVFATLREWKNRHR